VRQSVGDRVDAALASLDLTRAEAVEPVPIGYKAAPEMTDEARAAQIDPAAAAALLGYVPNVDAVTRKYAMRVPSIRRGRNLIAGTIGALPLICTAKGADGQVTPVDRPLFTRFDPSTTPAWLITATVDDLIFYPCAWWRVTDREVVGGERIGYPTAVERIDPLRVTVPGPTDADTRISIDGKRVPDRDVIRFDAPDEGLLEHGAPVVRLARALIDAGIMTASDEVPSGILRPEEGAPELTDAEVKGVLAEWRAARRENRTAWLNRAVTYDNVASDAEKRQLVGLAQWTSSELARLLNLPPSRIGAPQGSGMTYTNVEADRRDLLDTSLSPFLAAIAQRLSMGDVTPSTQRAAFDLTAYLRGTTSELVSAGISAIDARLASREEVRTLWLGLPPNPAITNTEASTA
jgi:hypothetical protein